MASKLARGSAGRQLFALAEGLSASMLAHELVCNEASEAVFSRYLGDVATKAVGHGSPKVRAAQIAAMARAAIKETEQYFSTLAIESVVLGVNSMAEELTLCERTMAAKYRGVAQEAVLETMEYAGRMATGSMDVYSEAAQEVLPWFTEQLVVELGAAMSLKEDPEIVIDRVISPRPLKDVDKHRGKGLWWKPLEHCNRIARETEIRVVNAARTEAMKKFDELARERRRGR